MNLIDLKYYMSEFNTDTDINGGKISDRQIVSGARNAVFPRVSQSERQSGKMRVRKIALRNNEDSDEIAYDAAISIVGLPEAGRKYLYKGDSEDTQADLTLDLTDLVTGMDEYIEPWTGTGQLETALSSGETSVSLTMLYDDYVFLPGGKLVLSNRYLNAQTIADNVKPGSPVEYDTVDSTWKNLVIPDGLTESQIVDLKQDTNHPHGWYLGDSVVFTKHSEATHEILDIKNTIQEDEDIGDGDGTNTSPALSTLSSVVNGIMGYQNYAPVVKATCGGVERTVNVGLDGTCSGYCSAGSLNMADGTWNTDITWTTAPDDSTDITITYYRKPYSYSGNVVTIELDTQVANPYDVADTYGGGAVTQEEIVAYYDSLVITSASGTMTEDTYSPKMHNEGSVRDTITIEFTSSSAFTASGAVTGSLGTGNISTNFQPVNPNTGTPYFTILSSKWGGSWTTGDTVVFEMYPGALYVWIAEVIPAGTSPIAYNNLTIESYTE